MSRSGRSARLRSRSSPSSGTGASPNTASGHQPSHGTIAATPIPQNAPARMRARRTAGLMSTRRTRSTLVGHSQPPTYSPSGASRRLTRNRPVRPPRPFRPVRASSESRRREDARQRGARSGVGGVSSGTTSCGPCDIGTDLPWRAPRGRPLRRPLSALCKPVLDRPKRCNRLASQRWTHVRPILAPLRGSDQISRSGCVSGRDGCGRQQLVQIERRIDRGRLVGAVAGPFLERPVPRQLEVVAVRVRQVDSKMGAVI